jgi:hypothetical protein
MNHKWIAGIVCTILAVVTLVAQEPQVINRSLTVRNNVLAGGSIRTRGTTGGGIGYATGAGAAVTQQTNRATGVAIEALSGTITTVNSSLAAEASAVFVVTDSLVEIGDVVVVSQRSGAVALNTQIEVSAVAAGSFSITVINNNVASGTAETGAIIINFAVVKAVSS